MLYAAKCYWPGVTQAELEQVAARAAHVGAIAPPDVAYLGSLLFADNDLVLCLFTGPSRIAVKRAGERAGVPWERLMATLWHAPDRRVPTETQ